MNNSNTIAVDYTLQCLRMLVEEYITQQRRAFTLQGVCSYFLYWVMEDGHTTNTGLFESSQLAPVDCERVCGVLEKIAQEGRIEADGDGYRQVMN